MAMIRNVIAQLNMVILLTLSKGVTTVVPYGRSNERALFLPRTPNALG
jgi:hypothetical protein